MAELARKEAYPDLMGSVWLNQNIGGPPSFGVMVGGTIGGKPLTYVTDVRYRAHLVPVREEFFGKKGPASTVVQVAGHAHPDWMVEIEAIAVV